MLCVGITGGIGSGKSTVTEIFSKFGIPTLDADNLAKKLMVSNKGLQDKIINTFGAKSYINGRLNRSFLSKEVFHNPDKLTKLNALVHPVVIQYGKDWLQQQHSPYAIKEAALFFESGSHKTIDFMIGVSAPENLRIKRVQQRDSLSVSEIKMRINQQMDEQKKLNRCDAIIINDGTHSLIKQCQRLHLNLLKISKRQKL